MKKNSKKTPTREQKANFFLKKRKKIKERLDKLRYIKYIVTY